MGFLAPEGTLTEEPPHPKPLGRLPVRACCPLVASAIGTTVRHSLFLPHPLSLRMGWCCKNRCLVPGFLVFGAQNHWEQNVGHE